MEIGALTGTPTDYSDEAHWLHLPENTDKAVDTFYIYPTVVRETDDPNGDVPLDDANLIEQTANIYENQATVYERDTNVYAPYYREKALDVLTGYDKNEVMDVLYNGVQRTDIYAALDYYFEHYNNGRPFIIAGHSQGSLMTKIVLEEYMGAHPEYYERMVAAYPIGISVTEEELAKSPHLKFAKGETDTGVIVFWNTEGAGNDGQDSLVILDGAKCINPLNWKTDSTYTSAQENLGSRLEKDGKYEDIVPGVADAQVNPNRPGSLLTTYTELESSVPAVFGPQSYHAHDYDFYYYNIQDNVAKRIAAYLNAK